MSDIQTVTLPRPVPVTNTRLRPPKKNIPQTKPERDAVLRFIRAYVEREKPVPPMPVPELRVHAERIVAEGGFAPIYLDYCGVLLNNEMWRETLATIPYERRLLLLPKCLRVEDKCPAPFDEFGLLCKQCGLCTIQDFQEEAERLGYAVLVAEGSAVVMSLIQTGQIEAIVGVSCLPVLERTFPYMEAAAVPGIAVPLLQDDCINTTVDIDWVWDVIHLTAEDKTRRLDLNGLQREIKDWFTVESLETIMGPSEGRTEALAREWLARDGKRWRPFLTVAAHQALRADRKDGPPEDLKKIAVAVECFHKASLIHDDIEDEDFERYGEKTLHAEHGIPVALNVGDLLIGEGYRLIGECAASPAIKAEMLLAAADGQRQLCRGQGAELVWARNPEPLKTREVLDIFRRKTAPAFEVALKLGASYAGQLADVEDILHAYSEALGIAYQIRDDIEDLSEDSGENVIAKIRPSLVLSTARERSKGAQKEAMEKLWRQESEMTAAEVRDIVLDSGTDDRCLKLLESYKEEAIRSLQDVDNANLKGLLRRVIGKIFNDIEIKGWCREFEEKNATPENLVESQIPTLAAN